MAKNRKKFMKENKENSSVLKHIDILQNIITRMSSASENCKKYSITLVTAIILFSFKDKSDKIVFISFIPISLFYILDAYYLSMERQFRQAFNSFTKSLNKGDFNYESVYDISHTKTIKTSFKGITSSMFSITTGIFYFLLFITSFASIYYIKNFMPTL